MATPAIAGTSLRAALDEAFATLPAKLRAPGSGGAACRQIADVYDQAIAARFAQATVGISVPLALVATGGWARRELAPHSDIDFIVLHDREEATAKQVSDRLLYPLWDEKLAIGHQLREPRAAARLARDDLATATALLDARHIAGERRLTGELVRATLSVLAPGGNPNDLIVALAAEKKARHDRFGASLYLLEPNLKQGIGALRDLATALWAAQVRWHPPRPGVDPDGADALIANLVARGHLTRRQGDVLANARDFMLRIRALIQLTTKRRFDQLTFEIQEAIAPVLYPDARPHEGDIRSAVAPAVEALMRDYYLHGRGVVQVADRLLESARVPARRKPRIAEIDRSFITFNGELAIKDPRLFSERPSEMVRLFRVAVAEQLPVYGHTRELAAETIARDPAPLANDPIAAGLLLDALVDVRDRAQPSAFEVMNQLGILSALMPEWAPCVGRVQHDLYHVYTVDQHQLYALAMQKRLARGELADEHPLAVELWKQVKRPAALFLGTLLHDVGKPLGKGHAEKGAIVADKVARRLGMSEDEAEVTEFLVRQHLTMAHVSQRRDLTDAEVIARFAERIGSEDRLTKLYLLTLCDTAMTSPDNLNAWKAGLLRELAIRSARFFRGESLRGDSTANDSPTDDREREARDKIVQVATADGSLAPDVAHTLVEGVDPRLISQLTARQAARHVKLVAGARTKQPPVALEVHCFPMRGHSELSIVAPDAPGVLAAIAGALTANRVDVLGAFLGHIDLPEQRRLVIDTFYVRDLKGEAIADDDPRWTRLTSDLRELLAGAPDPGAVASLIAKRRPKSGMPKRVTPGVLTDVRIHDDSTQATIVEVFTQDRVGVLHAITQTLADLDLDIGLAKVSTEGEKVADVFYVHRAGERITDEREREVLISRLRAALEAPGLTGS
ncbi:MAG TPA: [protein-PII] uridylyltransferase [Kofleriaceae bacterium]